MDKRITLHVICPKCGFGLNELLPISDATRLADGTILLHCESCAEPFVITVDDIRDAQHDCLVALGEN